MIYIVAAFFTYYNSFKIQFSFTQLDKMLIRLTDLILYIRKEEGSEGKLLHWISISTKIALRTYL